MKAVFIILVGGCLIVACAMLLNYRIDSECERKGGVMVRTTFRLKCIKAEVIQ